MSEIVIEPGAVLKEGQYLVEKQLNFGSTAVVWEGQDLHSGIAVALKVMYFSHGAEKKTMLMKQAGAEVKTASGIDHCNIAKLFDVFVENRYLVQVWELIQGSDMLGVINSLPIRRLPEDMAAYLFYQLLDGVLFLHNNGICHRDIKLENCMVSHDTLNLKLVDFGMSKDLDTVCTFNAGTPNYMAPELLTGSVRRRESNGPLYDGCAVDSWALGVILFVMVSGFFPFEDPVGSSVVSTVRNITSSNKQPLPCFITCGCRDLILNLLQEDPRSRLTLEKVSKNRWLLKSAAAYSFRRHIERLVYQNSQ